jgi:hypothetical protein
MFDLLAAVRIPGTSNGDLDSVHLERSKNTVPSLRRISISSFCARTSEHTARNTRHTHRCRAPKRAAARLARRRRPVEQECGPLTVPPLGLLLRTVFVASPWRRYRRVQIRRQARQEPTDEPLGRRRRRLHLQAVCGTTAAGNWFDLLALGAPTSGEPAPSVE